MQSHSRSRNAAKKRSPGYRIAVTLIITAATLLAIAFLMMINGSALERFAVAIVVLIVSGRMIATANGIKNSYGAYLLGGKRGIKLIESLAKRSPRAWTAFADWGLVFSFGLLSYPMFRKYVNMRMMAAGLITIVAVMIFVYPYLPIVLTFINIPQITSAAAAQSVHGVQGVNVLFYLFLAASIIGGFSVSTIVLILFSGSTILYSTLLFAAGALAAHPNYSILAHEVPGVAPLIPGLTIPFFAGIVSLFILLVVHEFSHGILARIAKVRIKSIGAILFGIVPMGAFVEPDEREVKRLSERHQNRISIAGVSANMLACLVFFIIALALLSYVLPSISTGGVLITQVFQNYSAYGVLSPNTTILQWDSVPITNSFDLAKVEANYTPGTQVTLTTNDGVFVLAPDAYGKLGISGAPATLTPAFQTANFLYAVAALSFGLNFFVAIFNLLPIPGFDGWRIYDNKIRNKRVLKGIAAALVIVILLNVLPWFWTLG